jgi:hypothetical protein
LAIITVAQYGSGEKVSEKVVVAAFAFEVVHHELPGVAGHPYAAPVYCDQSAAGGPLLVIVIELQLIAPEPQLEVDEVANTLCAPLSTGALESQ